MKFFIGEIQDEFARENFKRLSDWFQFSDLLSGFSHSEISFDSAKSHYGYTHRLGYVPTDVMQTYASNSAVVTWHFDEFDREQVFLSVDKACTVRFFIGRYRGQS